jgi:hypothetical protein
VSTSSYWLVKLLFYAGFSELSSPQQAADLSQAKAIQQSIGCSSVGLVGGAKVFPTCNEISRLSKPVVDHGCCERYSFDHDTSNSLHARPVSAEQNNPRLLMA